MLSVRRLFPAIIDWEISLWGNRIPLLDINYHEGEQFHCGSYTSGVKETKLVF